MNIGITRDMGLKLQNELGLVLEREMKIAGVVLGSSDLSVVLLNAGIMMVRTVAASIASMAEDREGFERAYDLVVTSIAEQVADGRDDSIERIIATRPEWASTPEREGSAA